MFVQLLCKKKPVFCVLISLDTAPGLVREDGDTDKCSTGAVVCSSVSSCCLPKDGSSPVPCTKEEQAIGVQVCGSDIPHASTSDTKESQVENLDNTSDNLKRNTTADKTTSSRLWEEVESCLVAAEGLLKDSMVSSESTGVLAVA